MIEYLYSKAIIFFANASLAAIVMTASIGHMNALSASCLEDIARRVVEPVQAAAEISEDTIIIEYRLNFNDIDEDIEIWLYSELVIVENRVQSISRDFPLDIKIIAGGFEVDKAHAGYRSTILFSSNLEMGGEERLFSYEVID